MRLRSVRDLSLLVARRRKELGLTQDQLAHKAGVRRATLADLERGSTSPSFATGTALLAALDLVLDAAPRARTTESAAEPARRRPSLDDVLDQVRS